MRSISFTEKELDFLRKQYQDELESAQKYVDQVSEILRKLGTPSTAILDEPVEKEPKPVKRRGRKPRVKAIEPREPKKRGPKPKPLPVPATKEVEKIVTKKATSRRKRKWRGVRLTPMSKPIQLKEPKEEPVEETFPEIESTIVPTKEPIIAPIEEPRE